MEDWLSRNSDDGYFPDGINREFSRLGGSKVLEDMMIDLNPGVFDKGLKIASVHIFKAIITRCYV